MNDPIRGLASAVAYQPSCRVLSVAGLGFRLTKVPPSPREVYLVG